MLKEELSAVEKAVAAAMSGNLSGYSVEEVGTVISVDRGYAIIKGLKSLRNQELVSFEGGLRGIAFNLDRNSAGIMLLGDFRNVRAGQHVRRTFSVVDIPVSMGYIGRIVNPLGDPLDEKGAIAWEERLPIEREAPPIMARAPVSSPLQTGIKVIDAVVPIGKGQRELILGDRQTGKTAIAIDTILNQKGKNVICVYVAIGQKQSTVASIYSMLTKAGAMDYSIIVSSSASDSAPLQYIAPYAGCTMAEYFMNKGKDVLIVYDDLSKHAVAYRAMSLLLRRPPGREAYPGDVFYIHSRLLERAARLSDELGGGSITALPIIETLGGDVTSYIPTNVISITDGQIFLESDLFYNGIRPAINPGISVSRVGGSAQTKAMKKVSGKLRLELAQYRELLSFSQFGIELDREASGRLAKGERLYEILKQPQYSPLKYEKEVLILYAAINDKLNDIAVKDIKQFEIEFFEYMDTYHREIADSIRKTGDLRSDVMASLDEAIEDFKASYFK